MPRDRAHIFLAMAEKDFTAVQAMTDVIFAVEIFGFHAQQTAEKCLKAWIDHLGGSVPITHNLVLLLTMLEELDVNIDEWLPLVELNSFAVQYRYEEYLDTSDDYDRSATIAMLQHLFDTVRQKLGQ
jgi:HEPN domain-containing protein